MPERWEKEVRKLRSLALPETVPQPRRDVGVVGPPMRQRAVAAVVALTVFGAAGVFLWRSLDAAVRGGPPVDHSPAATNLPPDVGRIRCTKHGTHTRTPIIQPQRDGVHILVRNASGGRWIEFAPVVGSPKTVGSSWSRAYRIDRTKMRELVILAGPGVGLVSCAPGARRPSGSPPGGFDRLAIVDPQGLWGPPDLACPQSEYRRFDVHGYARSLSNIAPPGEVRSNLPSLRPSDDVRLAGYPSAQGIWKVGPWYVVVRDGKSIAKIWFWQVDGAATIYACPGSGITRPGHPWNES